MRMSFLMELVVAVGFSLGLAHWHRTDPKYEGVRRDESFMSAVFGTGHVLLSGFGLIVGVGTWLERARGRSPNPWGIGRRTWSLVAIYVLADLGWMEAQLLARYLRDPSGADKLVRLAWESSRANCGANALFVLPHVLVALVLTEIAARPAGMVVKKDDREWAGRCFAAAIIAAPLALEIVRHLRA